MTDPLALPRIVALDLVRVRAGNWQPQHRHDHHEIHWMRSGRGTLTAGDRSVPVAAGAIYLFLPGEPHGGGMTAGAAAEVLYLGVRFPGDVAVARGEPAHPFFLTGAAALELEPPLRALAAVLAARRAPGVPSAALGPALRVVAAMVEPARALGAGRARRRALTDAALARLDRDPARPPRLAAIAADLGVSAGHLGESLALVEGAGWPELVARRRAALAAALLADRELPVREVARRVGLSDARALARLLRRVAGTSPRRLRR